MLVLLISLSTLLPPAPIPASAQLCAATEWLTSFEEAQQRAEVEQKPVFMLFSGSDWCASCIRMQEGVFRTDRFKAYAKEHFVLLELDFPRSKRLQNDEQRRQNESLAARYNPRGNFPYIVVLKDDDVLFESSFDQPDPEALINLLESWSEQP